MSKRVTKKLVRQALASFTGWDFAYNFKERSRIQLFRSASIGEIIANLDKQGVTVTDYEPYMYPCAGSMLLAIKLPFPEDR